jgi:hypothetical protein
MLVFSDGHRLRLSDEEFHMPPESDAHALVERYFELSTPFFQFLHRPTVKSLVDELYKQTNGRQTTQGALSQQKVTLLLMIFAVATLDDTRGHSSSMAECTPRYLK